MPGIRVLSYNIRHGEGMDRRTDLGRIARVIQSASPDVVSLQEVDYQMERTGGVDQAEDLAGLTGMNVAFGPAIIRRNGQYGNAVLSRHPVADVRNYPLPGAREPRAVLAVDVDIPSHTTEKITATFLATHLSLHEESRLRSVSFIEAILPNSPEPALLMGDLNARPESSTLDAFRKTWSNATENQSLITLLPKPVQIDYILFRPADRWRVINTWVIDERIASDHCPIAADLELLPL
ncbi:endonuclease/exonuclease/phosphatase family protein [Candidatus Poribacteria bacterium]